MTNEQHALNLEQIIESIGRGINTEFAASLRAGAAALRREEAANRWRPIAEAPRDGTKIDLWTADGERFTDCEWIRGCWRRQISRGWVRLLSEVTHWRPIPDPPEGA